MTKHPSHLDAKIANVLEQGWTSKGISSLFRAYA